MFDGIIYCIGKVKNVLKTSDREIILKIVPSKHIINIKLGSSVSCSGVCLTITEYDDESFSVYVSRETFSRTNFSYVKQGDYLNLSTPMKIGESLDGHFVQGHVDDILKISNIEHIGDSHRIKFEMSSHLKQYITFKGSIAIDGVSLTGNDVEDIENTQEKSYFYVNVIPYTFYNTTFQYNKVGDYVNVEVDLIARYIKSLIKPES